MDTWLSRSGTVKVCNRDVCLESIIVGSPQVGQRTESKRIYWHPNCWLEDGLSKLSQYESPVRGRKKLDLSSEDAALRQKLLQRIASYNWRIRRYEGSTNGKEYSLKIARLSIDIELLSRQLEGLGGRPDKWSKVKEELSRTT